MNAHDIETGARCAWCGGPLPVPVERLAVVRASDGETMTTCSTACQAELVVALAGRAKPGGRSGAGRMN
jgi:hypothetical protein